MILVYHYYTSNKLTCRLFKSLLKETAVTVFEQTLLYTVCHIWLVFREKSGRVDNSEACYVTRFGLKLGKQATETNEVLQTGLQWTCVSWAFGFRWHKRPRKASPGVGFMVILFLRLHPFGSLILSIKSPFARFGDMREFRKRFHRKWPEHRNQYSALVDDSILVTQGWSSKLTFTHSIIQSLLLVRFLVVSQDEGEISEAVILKTLASWKGPGKPSF